MQIKLHANAVTRPKVRRYIQTSPASVAALAVASTARGASSSDRWPSAIKRR